MSRSDTRQSKWPAGRHPRHRAAGICAMMPAGWVSMAAVGSNTDDAAPDAARVAQPARPAGRLLRVIGWATAAICAGAPVTLALGFAYFVWLLPADEIALTSNADGIV